MFKKSLVLWPLVSALIMAGSVSFATDKNHPYKDHMKKHPRQDEVNKRLDNETARANGQAASGEITKGQAAKMDAQDKKIYNQEQADKAKNGGDFITKKQQGQLNREENAVNREDKRDLTKDANHPYGDNMKGHPRQDQVNGRLDNETKRDNTQAANGEITKGQAAKMDGQNQKIFDQEQVDKRKNGGDFLTKKQQVQLNKEENGVNREDKRDIAKDDAAGN